MTLKITSHAALRMIERGIDLEGVVAVMNDPDAVIEEQDGLLFTTAADTRGKIWTVLLSVETEKIVTIRRANRKEVKQYEENKSCH